MSGMDFKEFHWMVSMINNIDAGLVVIDTEYTIESWNGFMFHHSNIDASDAKGKNIFELFPNIDKPWLVRKIEAVKTIQNQSFITWEQKPYIFPFKNYRPITGTVEYMYQNITILPLASLTGTIDQICLIIYDVTDIASNRLALQQANNKLHKLSQTDPLTQLNNRSGLDESLALAKRNFDVKSAISSLVMIDIDHFKKINDTYGHPAGDAILIQMADIISENIRADDSVARFGGEEFAIILPETSNEQANKLFERIRKIIEKNTFTHQDIKINITISYGVAQLSPDMLKDNLWMEASDQALYHAKNSGRNQGVIYDNMPPDQK